MITAEVAVYPLKTSNATNVINESTTFINNSNVEVSVDSMNTRLTGARSDVFKTLDNMFSEAENTGGEVSMVVTISNAG